MSQRANLTVTAMTLLIGVAGCTGSSADDPFRAAALGLCESSTMAEMGDIDRAGEVFFDLVHQPLHDLATETTGVDPATAARLLEAKQAVESGLDAARPDLAGAFRALVTATGEALAVTGHDPMPCSVSENP